LYEEKHEHKTKNRPKTKMENLGSYNRNSDYSNHNSPIPRNLGIGRVKKMTVTKKYLKESIGKEKAANKSYLKHSKGKGNKFLKEIAKDERHHRKLLTKRLKKLEKPKVVKHAKHRRRK
jgi:hypothetical protein